MVTERNPRDSMKSTWRSASKSSWGLSEWTFTLLGINPTNLDKPIPVFKHSDPIPYCQHWDGHAWIILHAIWPMIVQQAYYWYFGKNMATAAVFALYAVAYNINGIFEMRMLKRLGHKYGFLDGDHHARDQVPDVGTFRVFTSLLLTSHVRPLFTLFLSYRSDQLPFDANWLWMIVEVGAYGVILDFWFYWYHRVMHESETLWKYHRTHHLTKHPNALLSLYADHEQEFFDIMGIPLLTWGTMKLMGMPMGFHEWWMCHQYIVWTELFGHSGVRVHATPPTPFTPILSLLKAEIVTEDHDLHHRKGWKHSYNYGKQTRLWDRIFGTLGERDEMSGSNIDYNQVVRILLT